MLVFCNTSFEYTGIYNESLVFYYGKIFRYGEIVTSQNLAKA